MRIIFFLLLFPIYIFGQADNNDFGRAGAYWSYCYYELGEKNQLFTAKSLDDFVFNGYDCSSLIFIGSGYNTEIGICREGTKVYYKLQDSLHIIYDFALAEGDSLKVRYPKEFDSNPETDLIPDYFTYYIDLVDSMEIDGQFIKRQNIECDYYSDESYKCVNNSTFSFILENIGCDTWILPYIINSGTDEFGFSGLVSFKNNDLDFTTDLECVTSNLDLVNNKIILYPNPANDKLFLSEAKKGKYKIYDYSGALIQEGITKATIDIKTLKAGIYLIQLNDGKRLKVASLAKI